MTKSRQGYFFCIKLEPSKQKLIFKSQVEIEKKFLVEKRNFSTCNFPILIQMLRSLPTKIILKIDSVLNNWIPDNFLRPQLGIRHFSTKNELYFNPMRS